MKQRRSMLMAILLTLALVFTMMPAMVWADDVTAPDTNAYFFQADDLGVGNYVITVKDGDYMALKAPASRNDPIKDAQAVETSTVDGKLVVKNPDNALVWKSASFTANNVQGYKITNNTGSLYFTSGTQSGDYGLKYQNDDYRPVKMDGSKMYATSEKSQTPKTHYLVYDYKTESSAEKDFHTLGYSDGDGASAVTLFRQRYKVQYDLGGVSGTAPEAEFADETDSVKLPAAPTDPDGKKIFLNWGDASAKEEATVTVTGNTVFTANWDDNPDYPTDLANAKKAAKDELDKFDLSKYDKADQEKIAALILETEKAIAADSTDTVAKVNALVEDFKAEVAKIQTTEEKTKAEIAKVQTTAVQIIKPVAGKKKVTAKWVANSAVFEGYQVQYKVSKKKVKKWKTKNVANASASKKVIKKLKRGKKYKVRVRGYKTINGVKVYGPWSKTKTTKKKVK